MRVQCLIVVTDEVDPVSLVLLVDAFKKGSCHSDDGYRVTAIAVRLRDAVTESDAAAGPLCLRLPVYVCLSLSVSIYMYGYITLFNNMQPRDVQYRLVINLFSSHPTCLRLPSTHFIVSHIPWF